MIHYLEWLYIQSVERWALKVLEMLKVIMVTGLLPLPNYSTYLVEHLQKASTNKLKVSVFTNKTNETLPPNVSNVTQVWDTNLFSVVQIAKRVLMEKPHILHVQYPLERFFYQIKGAGVLSGLILPAFIYPILKLVGIRIITTLHPVVRPYQVNNEFLETFSLWPSKFLVPLVRGFFRHCYRTIGRFSSLTLVHSEGLRQSLMNDYGLNKDKVVALPHGVPIEDLLKTPTLSAHWRNRINGRRYILHIGYIHKRKGISLLIEAFDHFQSVKKESYLVLAGQIVDTHYKNKIYKIIKIRNLERKVILTGFVTEKEMHYLLANCEFLVFPYINSIAASGPLALAIAHKKPSIVSNRGVFAEELEDYQTGILCDLDVYNLTEKMFLLWKDQNLRKEISKNLANLGKSRSWSKIANRTVQYYFEISKERSDHGRS